jgi:hypothetical protein
MRNKQDITDYKKLWIASYLAMTDNCVLCNSRNVRRLPVIARHEAIQIVQLLYVINFPSLSSVAEQSKKRSGLIMARCRRQKVYGIKK